MIGYCMQFWYILYMQPVGGGGALLGASYIIGYVCMCVWWRCVGVAWVEGCAMGVAWVGAWRGVWVGGLGGVVWVGGGVHVWGVWMEVAWVAGGPGVSVCVAWGVDGVCVRGGLHGWRVCVRGARVA